MRAKVVIVGASRGVDRLDYEVPAALAENLQVGHRVLVPLRSRRVTGLVLELSAEPAPEPLKPILEILEPRPLFDAAHLKLLEFLASYYLTTLGEAYRSVVPSVARVESRMAYRLAAAPNELRAAALSRVERAIVEMAARRPATMKRLEKAGLAREVRAALSRLEGEGILARCDETRGRHRESDDRLVTAASGACSDQLRGPKQRAVLEVVEKQGPSTVDAIAGLVRGARPVIESLARRGFVTISTAEAGAFGHAIRESPFGLTEEQKAAVEAVAPAIAGRRFEAFLLWGVTASGKTEVYLNLAARVLADGAAGAGGGAGNRAGRRARAFVSRPFRRAGCDSP